MATSNAEILAQLEKLAEADGLTWAEYDKVFYGADFPAILAAVKRWVKIESLLRAALPVLLRDIANTSDSDLCRSRMFFEAEVRNTLGLPLDAALKEPA